MMLLMLNSVSINSLSSRKSMRIQISSNKIKIKHKRSKMLKNKINLKRNKLLKNKNNL